MYEYCDDLSRWVFEFTEIHGGLEKAMKYATTLKKTIHPLLMDGKVSIDIGQTSDERYISAARNLWLDFFEGNKYGVPAEIIETLSRHKGAPWVVFSHLKLMAIEEGYNGGHADLDSIIIDLAPGGALH